MAITILPCGCPCTDLEEPCDCCPCITNVKIYSNISFSIIGQGTSQNILESGGGGRPVPYQLNYTTSLSSLIDIANPNFISTIACPSCFPSGFRADASNGFISVDLDYKKVWTLAAGVECAGDFCPGNGFRFPPLEEGPCPMDVCLNGQIFQIRTEPPFETGDFESSNCVYREEQDGPLQDHISEYYCTIIGPFTNDDPTTIYASLGICPSTTSIDLLIRFGFTPTSTDTEIDFTLSTSSDNGPLFGYVKINQNAEEIPLYIGFSGPVGFNLASISGQAIIGIEFDYAKRDPETNLCPEV